MKDLTAQVESYIEKWTDILSLRDWRIKAVILEDALPDDLGGSEAAAAIEHNWESHEAHMRVVHPDKWAEINEYWSTWDESRLQEIIIHELLHLHFAHHHPHKKTWKKEREELAINQLINAFLLLDGRISSKEEG